MGWMQVSDKAAMEAMGLRPVEVSRLLMGTFATMAFQHGCVHGDPHPGNILVRRLPAGSQGEAKHSRMCLPVRRHALRRRAMPRSRGLALLRDVTQPVRSSQVISTSARKLGPRRDSVRGRRREHGLVGHGLVCEPQAGWRGGCAAGAARRRSLFSWTTAPTSGWGRSCGEITASCGARLC